MPSDKTEPRGAGAVPKLSWEQPAATFQRERAAEGMLVGTAIGEALALPRNGLSRCNGLRLFGRPPLNFRFAPGVAVPDEQTHAMIITVQAILESRADHRLFAKSLRKRIFAYRLSRPVVHIADLAWKAIYGRKNRRGFAGRLTNPLIRCLPISLMVQGTSSARAWLETSNSCTMDYEICAAPTLLLAHAMQIVQLNDAREFGATAILQCLSNSTHTAGLKGWLVQFQPFLTEKYSVARVAKIMGFQHGIPRQIEAITLISIYAWLRHLTSFRTTVERTACLGGECAITSAIAGALSGASLGKDAIPMEWRNKLQMYPYDNNWLEQVVARITDWPHGVEDIQDAHGEPVLPVGQCIRNKAIACITLIHRLLRLPTMFAPQPSKPANILRAKL